MKKISIFLASSFELKEERQLFEIEIYRKCKKWIDNGIFLHLDIWEDMSAQMSHTHSQDEYNKKVQEAEMLVVLAYTKVGKYTLSEFETAQHRFSSTDKPFIYVYFKANPPSTRENRNDLNTLYDFQDKLSKEGYFFPPFNDFNDLWNQFNKELDLLAQNQFTERSELNKNTNTSSEHKNNFQDIKDSIIQDNSIKQTHSGTGDNIGGNKIN